MFENHSGAILSALKYIKYKYIIGEAHSSHYIETVSAFTEDIQRYMVWTSQVGKWLNILPIERSHTVLGEQEFRENVFLR